MTKRKKKDQKSEKCEPQKEIKIDHENVQIQMPLLFTLLCKIRLSAACQKCYNP